MICQDGLMIDCPCTADCPRHGKCCECVANHAGKGNLPACLRFLKEDLKQERKLQRQLEKQERKQSKH